MAGKYAKPIVDTKKYAHERHPGGVHVQGTPDPGAIPTSSRLSTPEPGGQALTGTPHDPEKASAAPQKGRSAPGRSRTKGLKGTPNG